jgi:hypothetical protein
LIAQQILWARFTLDRPDDAYPWTGDMTPGYADSPASGPWFYARWDSPRYVEIAQDGYAEPRLAPHFPVYPLLMRLVDKILVEPLHLTQGRDGYALAGLIVSGIMSLIAVLAMDALASDWLDPESALRAVFYLLIFPTAFYMAQVYSEATYLAFALSVLFFTYRRQWLPASLLITLAALTRTIGILLLIPYSFTWFSEWWNGRQPSRRAWIYTILPLLAFGLWWVWLDAHHLSIIEAQRAQSRELFTWRGLLIFAGDLLYILREPNAIHIVLDLALTGIALAACWIERKRFPGLALYGLGAILLGIGSGQLVSMNRYALAVFPIYFVLARWGQHPAWDKLWTFISLLWFGLYLVLYVHGFWVG